MLQAMLLAALVAAPLGSLALFVPIRRHARRAGTWPAIRRLVLAVLGTVVLAAAVVVTLRLLSASRHNLIVGVAAVVFASLVWMPVTRRWSARAHLCWASTVFLFVVFLIYALEWTFDSHLGPASTAGGVLLWPLGHPLGLGVPPGTVLGTLWAPDSGRSLRGRGFGGPLGTVLGTRGATHPQRRRPGGRGIRSGSAELSVGKHKMCTCHANRLSTRCE